MRFSRLLLIIGIIVVISTFTLSTSFAASSETINETKRCEYTVFNKKVSTVTEAWFVDGNKKGTKTFYTISIKKPFLKKYKLKSVQCDYYTFKNETKVTFHKNYNANKKNKITLKDPNGYSLEKMTIKYYTKNKLKTEKPIDPMIITYNPWKNDRFFYGKKVNVKFTEKGYSSYKNFVYKTKTNYEKIKVIAKNKNY